MRALCAHRALHCPARRYPDRAAAEVTVCVVLGALALLGLGLGVLAALCWGLR